MSISYRYHNEQFFAKIFLSNSTESWTMLSAMWKNFFQRSPYQLTLCFWCLSFGLSGKRYARNVEFILKWNLLIFFLIIVDRKKAPEHSWYRAQLAIIRWEVKLLTLESEPGTTSCSPEISKMWTTLVIWGDTWKHTVVEKSQSNDAHPVLVVEKLHVGGREGEHMGPQGNEPGHRHRYRHGNGHCHHHDHLI